MSKVEIACPLRLKKDRAQEITSGMPWIYSGDIIESSELTFIPSGSLVSIESAKGESIGTGYYNASSPIACRVLTLSREPIDGAFFQRRFAKALAMRDALIGVPYYRLIHSEADGLPGLLVDRFGEYVVVQIGTAGMEALMSIWLPVLEELLSPTVIVMRNDTGARKIEGLKQEVTVLKGKVPPLVELQENGCLYLADLLRGQKTGWFFDQRNNRKMIADLAAGKTVADIYSHSGGFGLLAAKAGAHVTLIDSSALALDIAREAALRNNVVIETMQDDAFVAMQQLHAQGKRFDIVLADPPAFVKSRKDIIAGMKGYEKVTRLAAGLVNPGGLLFVASCSHHATRDRFDRAVMSGVEKAGMSGKMLRRTGAAGDHPKHPKLPQSEYLKGILLRLEKDDKNG